MKVTGFSPASTPASRASLPDHPPPTRRELWEGGQEGGGLKEDVEEVEKMGQEVEWN